MNEYIIVKIGGDGMSFTPSNVTIKVGDTVQWVNEDKEIPHSSTSDNGFWDSNVLGYQQDFIHTFTEVGTYPYHCRIHSFMRGTVNVTSS
jgi:plastocyanin